MSSLLRRSLALLLVLVLIVAGIWWFNREKPIPVVVRSVEQGKVEASIANTRAGSVEACLRTKLTTILGGRIEVMAVKEGDRVKKGDLLLKLWNDDQQAQIALAKTQVTSAQQRAQQACTQASNAARDAVRQAALREKGFISLEAEDTARSNAQASQAACAAARADVTQAQAKVAASEVERGRTVLYAPFDGTVAKIVGEVGEYSTPSPPGVATPPAIDLIDDSCVYIKAPMDEVDAPKIKPGQTVRIRLDALPKERFAGKVRRVAPTVSVVEKQARTVDIEVDFDESPKPGSLLVGYSADVEVVLALRADVLRIPTSAILEGNRVFVASQDGRIAERTLRTGLANWEYTEVLEGLAADDQLVLSVERAGLKAGALYRIEESATKAATQ